MLPATATAPAVPLVRGLVRLTWLLAAAGVLLRLAIWLQARSVYLDEVALLRNFLERDYAGLFRPLGYYQYAPPLFSLAMKASITVLGTSERAIRLLPLLAGCGAVVVFAQLALRWLPAWWAALGTATVAFSSLYLDFATACKQYSTDSLVALGLLLLTDNQLRQPQLTSRQALGWAALGSIAVWVSMPAIFVLAGVGLALAWAYRLAWQGPTGWRLLGIGTAWGLSFLGYFKLLLQADAQSGYLQQHHQDAFLVLPQVAADWQLLAGQLAGLADKGFGKTVLAIGLATVGWLAGGGYLLRNTTPYTWLLLTPLITCLAASGLHYYSVVPRLMLFWLPLALLVLLLGLNWLGNWVRYLQVILLMLGIVVLSNQQRVKYLFQPFRSDYADVRSILHYISWQQQPGDIAFIYYNEVPTAYYYLSLCPRPISLQGIVLEQYHYLPGHNLLQQDISALLSQGHRRIWLTYDQPDLWLRDWAARQGTVSDFKQFYNGYAFLLTGK